MSRGHCCFRPILRSVFTLTQNASVDKFIKQFSFGNTGQNNFGGALFAGIGLRGSLPKSGPLDFATKNTFPLYFVGEEALVGIY